MAWLKKHGYKLIFSTACVLLILSIAFTTYSFAKYLSLKTASGGAKASPIECRYTIKGGSNSFVNAPYMQIVSEGTDPVQMNQFSKTEIVLENYGKTLNLKYQYAFALYMPEDLLKNMMFQFVEMRAPQASSDTPETGDDNAQAQDDAPAGSTLTEPARASKIYKAYARDGGGYETGIATLDGVDKIPDDYESLSSGETELVLSSHIESFGTVKTEQKSVYNSFYIKNGVEYIMCPVEVSSEKSTLYYKLTVNLPATDNYVLKEQDGHNEAKYILRLSLNTAVDNQVFTGNAWVASDHYDEIPTVPKPTFDCQWDKSGAEPVLQIKNTLTDNTWYDVTIKNCIGYSLPVRLNMVFTQTL